MRIGLLNPAPIGRSLTKWGDYHFGRSLESALVKLGASVDQRFWPEWDFLGPVDLCITLRGKRAHQPPPGVLNAIWIISHPATVSLDELRAYDLVLTASDLQRRSVEGSLDCPVHMLPQCTDVDIFAPGADIASESLVRRDALFVANSRGIRRPILGKLLAAGFPVSIVGRHWENVGLSDLVKSRFVDNDKLGDTYRHCRIALNDHWCDMQYFGIVNNRIFDCLATGTPVMSDRFPELERICGNSALYVDGEGVVEESIVEYYFDYESLLRRARDRWAEIGERFTFQFRAKQILELAAQLSPRTASSRPRLDPVQPALIVKEIDELKHAFGRDTLRVLHVGPQASLQHALSQREDLNYISAGFGMGPWLVDLSEGFEVLAEGRYHCVILDNIKDKDEKDFWPLVGEGGALLKIEGAGAEHDGPASLPKLDARHVPRPGVGPKPL